MADDRDTSTLFLWLGLAVGLSLAAVAVAVAVLARKRDQGAPVPNQLGSPVVQQFFGAMPGAQSAAIAALPAPVSSGVGSSANTFRLPSLTDPASEAVRIAGSRRAMRVTVRPVDPPGSFASFAYSSSELNLGPELAAGAVPRGGAVASVPVGQEDTFYIKGGDALYAKGSDPGTLVSVTATPV